MRHQGPARQLQRPPVVAPLLRYVCHGPGRVDESDIIGCEVYIPIVLNAFGLARHLKYRVAVYHSINTGGLVRAPGAMGSGTKVHCSESANAADAQSARKGLGFDPVRRV